jgi:TonB family protein
MLSSMKFHRPIRWFALAALAALVAAGAPSASFASPRQQVKAKRARAAAADASRHVEEKTGTLTTRAGLRLRLITDLGNVRILTADSLAGATTVLYRIRIETDAHDAEANALLKQFSLSASSNASGVQMTGQVPWHGFHGRLWVSYEVTVPRRYNIDVTTQAGSIDTQDVDGRVSLVTLGGNITAGRIGAAKGSPRAVGLAGGPLARLETQGGHITVQDVYGDLRAVTAGGHINAGNVKGDAVLHTAGGNVRAGTIRGAAQLETGGGNISVQRTGSSVTATTGGGQIDFGEAAGSIRARTAGGAIRVMRVSGPMQLASSGGSIWLTQVRGGVRASTGAGNITAWFAPEPAGTMTLMRAGPALAPLASSGPGGTPPPPPQSEGTPAPPGVRHAPTPGAVMVTPIAPQVWKLLGASQLEAAQGDIIVYVPRELAVTIEAIVEMGGEHRIEADPSLPLKVSYVESGSGTKSVRGECTMNGGGEVLRLKTTSGNIRLKVSDSAMQADLYRRQIEEMTRRLATQQKRLLETFTFDQQKLQQQLEEQVKQATTSVQAGQRATPKAAPEAGQPSFFWDWTWVESLSGFLLSVPAEEQQKKLTSSVRPEYPPVAKDAGVEGTVRLRIVIGKDGTVQAQQIRRLSGPAILADAAVEAVKQWRYQPTQVDGKPVSVLTTVAIRFVIE